MSFIVYWPLSHQEMVKCCTNRTGRYSIWIYLIRTDLNFKTSRLPETSTLFGSPIACGLAAAIRHASDK